MLPGDVISVPISAMAVKLFMEVLSQGPLQPSFEGRRSDPRAEPRVVRTSDKHESAIVVFCEGSPPSLCGLGTPN